MSYKHLVGNSRIGINPSYPDGYSLNASSNTYRSYAGVDTDTSDELYVAVCGYYAYSYPHTRVVEVKNGNIINNFSVRLANNANYNVIYTSGVSVDYSNGFFYTRTTYTVINSNDQNRFLFFRFYKFFNGGLQSYTEIPASIGEVGVDSSGRLVYEQNTMVYGTKDESYLFFGNATAIYKVDVLDILSLVNIPPIYLSQNITPIDSLERTYKEYFINNSQVLYYYNIITNIARVETIIPNYISGGYTIKYNPFLKETYSIFNNSLSVYDGITLLSYPFALSLPPVYQNSSRCFIKNSNTLVFFRSDVYSVISVVYLTLNYLGEDNFRATYTPPPEPVNGSIDAYFTPLVFIHGGELLTANLNARISGYSGSLLMDTAYHNFGILYGNIEPLEGFIDCIYDRGISGRLYGDITITSSFTTKRVIRAVVNSKIPKTTSAILVRKYSLLLGSLRISLKSKCNTFVEPPPIVGTLEFKLKSHIRCNVLV